jgi:hypothetical protein
MPGRARLLTSLHDLEVSPRLAPPDVIRPTA